MKRVNQRHQNFKRYGRPAMYLLLGVLFGLLLYHERSSLRESIQAIRHADVFSVVAAVGLMLLSVGLGAGVYRCLATVRLPYWRTVLVQAAGLFVNKLLPAGSGALSVNFLYLRASGMASLEAGSVAALNNLVGFVGHMTLLGIVLILFRPRLHLTSSLRLPSGQALTLAVVVVAIVVPVVAAVVFRQRRRLAGRLAWLRRLFGRPYSLIGALALSIGITICYAACVRLSASSVGVELGPVECLLVLTLSVFATSVVPTPGGIGAAEAGVYFALKAYGVSDQQSLAIALLYRVATFWVPLVLGAVSFVIVSKQKLLNSSKM